MVEKNGEAQGGGGVLQARQRRRAAMTQLPSSGLHLKCLNGAATPPDEG
jgi:hypothetical protein